MVVISKQNLDYSINSGLNDRQPNISFPETTAKAAYMNILNQQAGEDGIDSQNKTDTEEQELNTEKQKIDTEATKKKRRKAERMKQWQMKKERLKNQKKKNCAWSMTKEHNY